MAFMCQAPSLEPHSIPPGPPGRLSIEDQWPEGRVTRGGLSVATAIISLLPSAAATYSQSKSKCSNGRVVANLMLWRGPRGVNLRGGFSDAKHNGFDAGSWHY